MLMKLCYDHDEFGILYMWTELEDDERSDTDGLANLL